MGQYIQDGPRTLMETIVSFEKTRSSVSVPFEMGDPDGLNYLAGKDYADICRTAADADAFLTRRGIIVRAVGAYGLPDSLRVTIGTADDMRAVVAALKAFIAGAPA